MKAKTYAVLMTVAGAMAMFGATAWAEEPAGGVSVVENENSVTGYTATFTYYNDDAEKVELKGGFQFYVDGDENVYANGYHLKDGDDISNYYVDPEDWSNDKNLVHAGDEGYVAEMEKDSETGAWTYSLDLPGGYYLYQYNVYSDDENFESVTDPENVCEYNAIGAGQVRSQFYVPYDEEKQSEYYDWSWCLPLEDESQRGSVEAVQYPGKDGEMEDALVYVPNGYDSNREEGYKVLYLSHGYTGDQADWFYQGHAVNIVDRLIAEGKCEPFIMVAMNNTVFQSDYSYWIDWDYPSVVENAVDYLFPYVEETFNISDDVKDKAFAGLSDGGTTTAHLYIDDPERFGYFGIFSCAAAYSWPELENYDAYKTPNVFLSAGYADFGLISAEAYHTDEDVTMIGMAEKLDEAGITYNNGEGIYLVPGSHDWFDWPQVLEYYVTNVLWK